MVLFYPGTFTRSATSGSVMSLFNCLPGDNYYRAQNLREMSVQLEA
ncbi:BREX protein BrxB domain-containing protein [Bifidobacterium longum]